MSSLPKVFFRRLHQSLKFLKNKWFLSAIAALLPASLIASMLIDVRRSDLGISDDKYDNIACKGYEIPSFWSMYNGYPNYNAELVALYFAPFAAYANDVYGEPSSQLIASESTVLPFSLKNRKKHDVFGGFQSFSFIQEGNDSVNVMVVFRGTDEISDNISNLSYITQMINPWDQYETARNEFIDIRKEAKETAEKSGKPIRYLAVGHSLGGGLARHIGYAFPCVSVITFNSSFVTNKYRLAAPYEPHIVEFFEKDDILTFIGNSWRSIGEGDGLFRTNKNHQWYSMNLVVKDDNAHSIYKAASAMARIPHECFLREQGTEAECKIDSGQIGEPEHKEVMFINPFQKNCWYAKELRILIIKQDNPKVKCTNWDKNRDHKS